MGCYTIIKSNKCCTHWEPDMVLIKTWALTAAFYGLKLGALVYW